MFGVTIASSCSTCPSRSARSPPVSKEGIKFTFTPYMEAIVRGILAGLSAPPSLASPTGMPTPAALTRSTCVAAPASTVLALRLHGIEAAGRLCEPHRAYQPFYPKLGYTLDSARSGSRQHCLGHLGPSRLPFGARSSAYFWTTRHRKVFA